MAIKVTIRFYEELNEFLTTDNKKRDIEIDLEHQIRVEELIRSLGPPCSIIDLILINGQPADLYHVIEDNNRISVYPVFERFNIKSVSRVKNAPLRHLKFICDVHLGRLTKFLRMLGFDTRYKNNYDDNLLIRLSNSEQRILLSRDKGLLSDKQLTRRYEIKHTGATDQIREVMDYFDAQSDIAPLSRCLRCNGEIHPVLKAAVKDRVAIPVFKLNNEFSECRSCGRLYWKGSHFDSMMKQVHEIFNIKVSCI